MPSGIRDNQIAVDPGQEVRRIPSWPNYGAGRDGRIWSYRNHQYRKPRLMKRGYLRVNLSHNNVSQDRYVHLLVAEAWLPNPDKLSDVNHKDGIKTNCSVENLERCTKQYNHAHAWANGLRAWGERGGNAKLKEKDVRDIRRRISRGEVQIEIAARYGVNKTTITDIKKGRSWRRLAEVR